MDECVPTTRSKRVWTIFLGATILSVSAPTLADWTGQGEGGLLLSRGNSDSTSINAKADVARVDGPWKNVDRLLMEYGSSNPSVANDFGVQVSMTDRPALSFGYGVRHNTDPAQATKTTDQLTAVNVVYNIKVRGEAT